jgi:Na+-driven multidrug efflux pump
MPPDRKTLFLEGPIGAALIRLAIPIILGNLLQTGYQLTDAFWVGRLGAAAVAAVSVSFPLTVAVISVLWFTEGGWKTSRLTGEDRQVIKVAEETIAEEGIV